MLSFKDGSSERILVVDDSALQRGQIRDSLEKNGYPRVWECKAGIESVIKYKMLKPDLLIACISSLMDIEALKNILTINPVAKILVIGAEGSESYIAEAVQSGAQQYLLRPYNEETFLIIIKGMIG